MVASRYDIILDLSQRERSRRHFVPLAISVQYDFPDFSWKRANSIVRDDLKLITCTYIVKSLPTIDPNAKKNRVPTESELSWLNKTAERLSCSINNIKEDLKEDEEAHNTLVFRQQRLLQELEGIQSQIHSSTRIMQAKRQQYVALEAEFKNVASLRHPVRRLPFEILQCIFEYASGRSKSTPTFAEIRIAIKISHVCQRWRSVAIDTPRMWSSIAFSLQSHHDGIAAYCSFLASRVKHVPATISITRLDMQNYGRLTACNLPQIQEIKRLALLLKDPRCFDQLYALPSFLPEKGVDALAILQQADADSNNGGNHEDLIWDLGKLVAHLPTIRSLQIVCPHKTSITPASKLAAITTLVLLNVQKLDFPLILSLMVNLSDLEVRGASLAATQQATGEITSHLRKFVMYRCSGDWPSLSQISFPILTTLIHDRYDRSNQVISSIQDHKSITTSWALRTKDIVSSLASTSPQLQSLGISHEFSSLYKRKISKTKGTPFPELRDILLDTRFHELALTDFEGIVRGRCLPSDHPDSDIMPSLRPLRTLTILRDIKSPVPEVWRDSNLFRCANQVVMPSPYHSRDEELILKWG